MYRTVRGASLVRSCLLPVRPDVADMEHFCADKKRLARMQWSVARTTEATQFMDVTQQRPTPDDVSDEDIPDIVCHSDEPVLEETDSPPDASPSAHLLQPPSTSTRPIPQPVCDVSQLRGDRTTVEPDASHFIAACRLRVLKYEGKTLPLFDWK